MLIPKDQASATARVINSRRYAGRLSKTARSLYTSRVTFQPDIPYHVCRGSPASFSATMARKKHTVLLQLALCWLHSLSREGTESMEPLTSRYEQGAPYVTGSQSMPRLSQQQSAGLIWKARLLQGTSQLKRKDRQKFYTAFGVSAKEADGYEASIAAAEKGIAEPANKRRRTAKLKASLPSSCHCTKPAM